MIAHVHRHLRSVRPALPRADEVEVAPEEERSARTGGDENAHTHTQEKADASVLVLPKGIEGTRAHRIDALLPGKVGQILHGAVRREGKARQREDDVLFVARCSRPRLCRLCPTTASRASFWANWLSTEHGEEGAETAPEMQRLLAGATRLGRVPRILIASSSAPLQASLPLRWPEAASYADGSRRARSATTSTTTGLIPEPRATPLPRIVAVCADRGRIVLPEAIRDDGITILGVYFGNPYALTRLRSWTHEYLDSFGTRDDVRIIELTANNHATCQYKPLQHIIARNLDKTGPRRGEVDYVATFGVSGDLTLGLRCERGDFSLNVMALIDRRGRVRWLGKGEW